jgi:hypothetical protein
MCDPVSVAIWHLLQIGLAAEVVLLMSLQFFFCRFFVVHVSPSVTRELKSPAAEPHAGGRHTHTYDRVLPGAPKGPFVTLLSPPQCYADFVTMPHTLASVDQSPVCRPRTLPPPREGRLGLDFGGVLYCLYKC